ncbi:hypothetical protein FHR99_003052 [Litorivivens lipolytica]|uniref:Uncharacterized protein n=1 Tax=Litorivivens lipolytica TaxID=1524264 RepID=A0A7W4W875_9GAMM|nr:hypothetical protein [Litorivivens lipolytica]MBB3048778.1 hypothetical protein [Litorivivens lipolytica]
MTTMETASPRAQLVEGLWQLKQLCEEQDKQGLGQLHFNTLLKDPDYRLEFIRRATGSRHPKIREMAKELLGADRHDVLISRDNTVATRRSLNADAQASQHQPHQSQQGFVGVDKPSQRQVLIPSVLTLLFIIAAATTWLLRDSLGLSSSRVLVSGSLFGEQRWTADKQWILEDIVYLEAGGRLVIDPGTQVLGKNGSALVITRDATLHARGTQAEPIVFTSANPVGARKAGDWGGLVMLGNAPVNVADARIEGVPANDSRAAFGGNDPAANCGVLEYARIEFAGFEAYANNELNGLTLGGCGSNSIVRHVQVHQALDDGVEVFGGNVDLKHILITGAGDDSLDWDLGWRGRVQFLVVQQYPGVGDNAFEGDNNGDNHSATPRSEPVFHNVTLISSGDAEKYQRAMTLREGTGGHFNNMLIQGFSGELIDLRDLETVRGIGQTLTFSGLLVENIGADGKAYFANESSTDKDDDSGFSEARYFASLEDVHLGTNVGLTSSAARRDTPDYIPLLRSLAQEPKLNSPEGEFWDEAANYHGAMRPGSKQAWTHGWTAFPDA